MHNICLSRDSDSEDSSDRPVQGPLPYEPEDAPWKKSEMSGIRKLWVPEILNEGFYFLLVLLFFSHGGY